MNSGYYEHLGAFVTIAKSGSLTRASVATGAGQSTLSRQLAALERHLGCTLFHRTATAMSQFFNPTLTRRALLMLSGAAAGARWFGYPTFWNNRLSTPLEELEASADLSGSSLEELADLLRKDVP